MSPYVRELYLKVHRGASSNLPYLFWIAQHRYSQQILEHLIAHQRTGEDFTRYIQEQCKGQPIVFFAKVSKEMLRVNTAPALLKGVNFR